MLNPKLMALTLSQIYDNFLKGITITNYVEPSYMKSMNSKKIQEDKNERSIRSPNSSNNDVNNIRRNSSSSKYSNRLNIPIELFKNNLEEEISKLPKYINRDCKIHNITYKCPICGHIDCNCEFNRKKQKIPDIPITPNLVDTIDKNEFKETADEFFKNLQNSSDNNNSNTNNSNDNNTNGFNNQGTSSAQKLLDLFSKCIDANLQMATPITPNLSILTAMGSLFLSDVENPMLRALDIAGKVMLYWTICIAPIGTPMAGQIVAVIPTNTAALVFPMAMELLTLKGQPGDVKYEGLCNIIVNYSKQVIWIVNEITPVGVPVPFTVQVT